jgi:alpha-beta hydrolase superfamily lysophospholipase
LPSGIFEGAAGKDFYRRIMQELRDAGGYRLAHPGQRADEEKASLYVFTYDWRQDNVKTVQKLDELIEQIRRDYGDPALKVDVIAHSMGGLVVQYFERYGTVDVLGGNSFQVTGLGIPEAAAHRAARHAKPGHGHRGPQVPERLRRRVLGLPTEGVATMPSTSSSSRTRSWTGS